MVLARCFVGMIVRMIVGMVVGVVTSPVASLSTTCFARLAAGYHTSSVVYTTVKFTGPANTA